MPDQISTDDVLRAYIECAIWSSTDDDGAPLDRDHDASDIAPEALESMREDVRDFLSPDDTDWGVRFGRALDFWALELGAEQIGHDLWLTRNRHGAGFWDRFGGDTEGARHGDVLTEAARAYGTSDLYIGDNGRIYVA